MVEYGLITAACVIQVWLVRWGVRVNQRNR
jgi:hypothetical protein